MYDLHGTELNFIHGRIKRAVGGFITGGPTGAVGGFISGGGGGGGGGAQNLNLSDARRRAITRAMDAASSRGQGKEARAFARELGLQGRLDDVVDFFVGSGCQPPLVKDVNGECVAVGSPRDFQHGGGAAVMGRYGAAIAPMRRDVMTLDCLPGMVLGKDNLCYNRRDIRNTERKWPKGTRPLGTPGEMAALRKAASFGRRMETTIKRMQKIGVIKKPSSRRAHPKPKMLAPGSGVHVVNVE